MVKKSIVVIFSFTFFLVNFCKPYIVGMYNFVSPDGFSLFCVADKHLETDSLTEQEEAVFNLFTNAIDNNVPLHIIWEAHKDFFLDYKKNCRSYGKIDSQGQECIYDWGEVYPVTGVLGMAELCVKVKAYLEKKMSSPDFVSQNVFLEAGDFRGYGLSRDKIADYYREQLLSITKLFGIFELPSAGLSLAKQIMHLRWKISFINIKREMTEYFDNQSYWLCDDSTFDEEFKWKLESRFADVMFLYQIITASKPVIFYAGAAHVENVVAILKSWGYVEGSSPTERDQASLEAEYAELVKNFELLVNQDGVSEKLHSHE